MDRFDNWDKLFVGQCLSERMIFDQYSLKTDFSLCVYKYIYIVYINNKEKNSYNK